MAKKKKGSLTESRETAPEKTTQVKETKAEKKARKKLEKQSRKEQKAKKAGVFKRIGNYFRDLKSEMKKVVWPTRARVIRGTIVVITMVVIVAVFVMLLDFGFNHLLALVFGDLV